MWMKRLAVVTLAGLLLAAGTAVAGEKNEQPDVAVVTGGHNYDEEMFPRAFKRCETLDLTFINHKQFAAMLEDGSAAKLEAVVLYSMGQELNEEQRSAFREMLGGGTGLVVLHHALLGYRDWPGFYAGIGGRFFGEETEWKGDTYEQSGYRHDVAMTVRVADEEHPITRGMQDFELHDETYNGMWVSPDSRVLLTTDHEAADRELTWVKRWNGGRVACIQPGHGAAAFESEPYQKLVHRAMLWVAGKDLEPDRRSASAGGPTRR